MAGVQLFGSAGSLEAIKNVISRFYYSSNIKLVKSFNEWEIHNSKGKIAGVRVIKKGQRYRFESSPKERRNPKPVQGNTGYRVKVQYHVGDGSRFYYLDTHDGVSFVDLSDVERASVYKSKVNAVKAIHRLARTGRRIIGFKIVETKSNPNRKNPRYETRASYYTKDTDRNMGWSYVNRGTILQLISWVQSGNSLKIGNMRYTKGDIPRLKRMV